MPPLETPDPNGARFCLQRWNHREEITVVEDGVEWCPVCLNVAKTPS